MTAPTSPIRSQKFLRILVALALALHASDGRTVEGHADLIRDAQGDRLRLLVDRGHRPVNAARRHHAIAALHRAEQRLALALLLLLRADQEEVEDREDRAEEDDLREDGAAAGSARRHHTGEHELSGG